MNTNANMHTNDNMSTNANMHTNDNMSTNIGNTNIMKKVHIFKQAKEKFGGVVAAEFIAGIDTGYRHIYRVKEAATVALAAANGNQPLAGAVLAADTMGVGGQFDCEGLSTLRIPALAALGKGRKNAKDGGAWNAAIQAAIEKVGFAHFVPSKVGLVAVGIDGSQAVVPFDLVPIRWQIAICHRVLWVYAFDMGLVQAQPPTTLYVGGGPREWGELLEHLNSSNT